MSRLAVSNNTLPANSTHRLEDLTPGTIIVDNMDGHHWLVIESVSPPQAKRFFELEDMYLGSTVKESSHSTITGKRLPAGTQVVIVAK